MEFFNERLMRAILLSKDIDRYIDTLKAKHGVVFQKDQFGALEAAPPPHIRIVVHTAAEPIPG